jgi:hypothetical protein
MFIGSPFSVPIPFCRPILDRSGLSSLYLVNNPNSMLITIDAGTDDTRDDHGARRGSLLVEGTV